MELKNDYESSRFYKNDTLNTIALELRNEIGELIDAIESIMGNPTDIYIDDAQKILKKANENPVSFIKELVDKNFQKLTQIRQAVGSQEESYIGLSNGLIMVVVGILALPINYANIRAEKAEFISELGKSTITKMKNELLESKQILNSIDKLQIAPDAQGQINNLLKITDNVLGKIKA